MAQPTEGADDLVGDQETSYSSQISRTRSKYPGGGGKQPPEFCTGSRKTAATVSGPSFSMATAISFAAQQAELLLVVLEVRRAVVVGVRDPERRGHQRLERRLHPGQAGDRERALRGAVVGDRAADHLVLVGLADELEVVLGQLPGGLDGLAATGGEEDPVQVARCVVRDPLGELDGVAGGRRTTAA